MEKIRVFTRELYLRCYNYGDKSRVPLHSTNTCGWFLEHPNLVRWKQSTEPSAIWVTADAGCGKSVLAKFLIGQLLSDNHTVIHFFFHHDRYGKNILLCALLHQLLTIVLPSEEAKFNTMLHMLCDELEYKGEKIMDEDEILWKIICNATTGSKNASSKLFCIIDGLDECKEQSRSPLIDLIVSAFSTSGTARQTHQPPNILITSRPYPIIEEQFRPISRIRLRIEDETPAISQDIETMITDKIHNLNPMRFPSRLQEYLHTEISQQAGRTFLWVKLIFEALEKLDSTTMDEVRKLLDTNPSELNTFYEFSLSGTTKKGKTRRLLQILLVTPRPLELYEVNVFLQIRESCMSLEDIDLEPDIEGAVKRLCGSLLRITDSTVDFVHQSAREFLTVSHSTLEQPRNLTWEASINVYQSFSVFGSICLWYLALTDWDDWKFHVKWYGDKLPHEWVTHHGRSYMRLRNGNQSEESHRTDSTLYTPEEFDKMSAEVEKSWRLFQFAAEIWPFHSEGMLQMANEAGCELDPDSSLLRPLWDSLRESGVEAGSKSDPDSCQLRTLLASLRESGMSKIRRFTNTHFDPFVFLQERGVHHLVNLFLDGPRIEGHTDKQILKGLCDSLARGKGAFIRPLLRYATAVIGVSEQSSNEERNKWFSRVAYAAARNCSISTVEYLRQKAEITLDEAILSDGMNNAVSKSDFPSMAKLIDWGARDSHAESLFVWLEESSRNQQILSLLLRTQDYRNSPEQLTGICPNMFAQYRFDQEDQCAELTEIFECFLRHLLDMPLRSFIYVLLEAIWCRHPCLDYLIRSRVDLICATKGNDELHPGSSSCTRTHCALYEVFCVACSYDNPASFLLFEHYCSVLDVNQADALGVTPLIAAIHNHDYSRCEWFLGKGAKVDVCVSYNETSSHDSELWARKLCLAVPEDMLSDPPRTSAILDRKEWKNTDSPLGRFHCWERHGMRSFDGCPLTASLRVKNLPIFRLLLKHGGDPWQDYEAITSVLAVAASYSEDFFDEVADLIRNEKTGSFDINRPQAHSRKTLLHIAAESGLWNSVIKLISDGSIVNVRDARGQTPLHAIALCAPTLGRAKTFKELVEHHHADANMANNTGKTPLDLLEESVSNLNLRNQNHDHIQTYHFLQWLEKSLSYLPSVRRTVAMVERLQRAAPSSEVDFSWENSSDELDLESGLGSDVIPETMSDIHNNGDDCSDANDYLGSSQPVPENTSASQPHEERGLFPWLFLC